jgi:hypothetical protein
MADIESQLSALQLQVYDLIRSAGWEGCTVDELEVATGRTHQSISARVNELENWKPTPLVERRAAKRNTRTGRPAWIFIQCGLKRVNKEEG